MKKSKIISAIIATSFTSSVMAAEVLISTTSTSSSHYGYMVAVNKLINDKTSVKSSITTGSGLENIKRLQHGQAELGLIATNAINQANQGIAKFKGKKHDLRILWLYVNAPQNVIVRADSGIRKLTDLNNAKINPGLSSTAATAEAVFKTLEIKPNYVRGSTANAVSAIKDNRISGYIKSGAGNKLDGSSLDVANSTKIRVLSLSEKQANILRQKQKDVTVITVPAGSGEGIPSYKTWSYAIGVGVHKSMDNDTAYQITKAVMEDKVVQASAFKAVKGSNLAKMTLELSTVPLHSGAVRWFKENGYKVPSHLIK